MRISFRIHRAKDKAGNLKKEPVSILVAAYSKEIGRIELATGEKILPKFWGNGKAKPTMTGHDRLNDHLLNIEQSLIQLWRDNKNNLSAFKSLMTSVVRGSSSSEKKTLFDALDKFLDQYKAEKEAKTLDRYNALKTRLTDFNKIYPVDFETLDFNFYDSFKKFLYSVPNPNYRNYRLHRSSDRDTFDLCDRPGGLPVGLFDDTVYKYFVNLKTFLRWSEKRGYKIHPSHNQWETIKRKHPPISLTLEELNKLQEVNLPKHLDVARDYLLLECFTGQRISDIKRFDRKDYNDFKWTFQQKKGNRVNAKTVTVHFVGFSKPALLILAKYNFKLPVVHEVTINKNIKTACKDAGINNRIIIYRWAGSKKIAIHGSKSDFISSHTGRKTFITLALSHGMTVEEVMELTGISEYQTIKHYKAEFEHATLEKSLEKVSENMTIMKKAV